VHVACNTRGVLIEGDSSGILVEHNLIEGSLREDGLSFRDVRQVEVRHNVVVDNGRIWEDRISGISFNGTFRAVRVHHNLVVRSNSDGIELMGYVGQELASDVDVFRNVLRDNGEQGVWLFRTRNARVHHNYIEGSHNNGVFLEGWVSGATVECNTIVRCGGTPGQKHHGGGAVAIQRSPDNTIRYNIGVDSSCGDISVSTPAGTRDWMRGMDRRMRQSAGNVIHGNVLCSSEWNLSVGPHVVPPTITHNVVWRRTKGAVAQGCQLDGTNIESEPLFRAPQRGDFALRTGSPGAELLRHACFCPDTVVPDPNQSGGEVKENF
jgi:hypothetical protein